MGPVRQNPIQRTIRSVHMCVHRTVHNCCTQYCKRSLKNWRQKKERFSADESRDSDKMRASNGGFASVSGKMRRGKYQLSK